MATRIKYPAIQADDAFAITPSDTVNIVDDAGNTKDYPWCYVHNPSTGGTLRVLLAGQADSATPVTIYIAQGAVFPAAIKRVYATTPAPPAGLIGLVGKA